MKERVQKFGRFHSGMVMPHIGAFIAWGLIAALFIEDGWFPNAAIARMVTPMLQYLLPIHIGYTGGEGMMIFLSTPPFVLRPNWRISCRALTAA